MDHLIYISSTQPCRLPFHSTWLKKGKKLWFGTFVMESEWILPNVGLLVSVSRCTGLVSMVVCSAFLLLAGMQLGLRLDKSVDTFHTLVPCPLMTMNHLIKNNVIFLKLNCSCCLVLTLWSQVDGHDPLGQWSFEQVWQVTARWVGLWGFCNTSHLSTVMDVQHQVIYICVYPPSFTTGGSKDLLDLMCRNTTLKEHLLGKAKKNNVNIEL